MADTKTSNRINFPRGTIEEMLRMMRECREKGNIDCELIMKEFMGKEFRKADYKKIKKKLIGGDSE
jgi:hypothetical protein